MTNPDMHQPKKGAPDYRKAWGEMKSAWQNEQAAHFRTRTAFDKEHIEHEQLKKEYNNLQNNYTSNMDDLREAKSKLDKSEEYTDHALDDRDSACKECRSSVIINWALFGVIVLMIIWVNNYMELIG